ncbi:MAG: hypothetical protein ABII00_02770 [Elusimicrobiota bacterium]
MRLIVRVKQALAASLCAALWLTAPGLGTYRALAQATMAIPSYSVRAPLGGVSAGGAAGSFGRVPGTGLGRRGATGSGAGPSLESTLVPAGSVRVNGRAAASASLALPGSAIGVAAPGRFVPALFEQAAQHRRAAADEGAAGRRIVSDAATASRARASDDAEEASASPSATSGEHISSEAPSESLHAIRGKRNRLGRHFAALRAAFGLREDADLRPGQGVETALDGGRMAAAVEFAGRAVSAVAAPLRAAGGRLAAHLPMFAGRRAYDPAPLIKADSAARAPEPLVLRQRNGRDLRVVIEPSGKAAASSGGARVEAALDAASGTRASLAGPSSDAGLRAAREGKSPKKGAWFGLGKVAVMFIVSLVVAQIGVESLGAAMPALVQKTFGDFTAVAQLAIFSSIASIVGRQLGPIIVKSVGLKNSYLGASAVRLVSISLLAGLLATGNMTLPLMMVFFSINGLLSGVSMTAMESIPPALVGQDPAKLERFWTWQQTILEIVAIPAPIVTGLVVASFGFLPALVAFPLAMFGSLLIVLKTLRIPQHYERLRKLELTKQQHGSKGFWARVAHGAKVVWTSPVLRTSFLAYTVYVMLNPFLYTMLGPAYGLRLVGPENAELATGVIGFLTGFYSAGGLLGGLTMMWGQRRSAAKKQAMREAEEAKNGPISDERWAEMIKPWEAEALRKSMLRWMSFGTFGLAALVTLMFPLPMLGSVVALPAWLGWLGNLTLPAVALIPFGIAQVISVLKLRSFFQSRVPREQDMPDAMGFFGSASVAVSTAGLLALKFLFQGFEGFTPFAYVSAALVPLAVFYLYLRWQLNRRSAPKT